MVSAKSAHSSVVPRRLVLAFVLFALAWWATNVHVQPTRTVETRSPQMTSMTVLPADAVVAPEAGAADLTTGTIRTGVLPAQALHRIGIEPLLRQLWNQFINP